MCPHLPRRQFTEAFQEIIFELWLNNLIKLQFVGAVANFSIDVSGWIEFAD